MFCEIILRSVTKKGNIIFSVSFFRARCGTLVRSQKAPIKYRSKRGIREQVVLLCVVKFAYRSAFATGWLVLQNSLLYPVCSSSRNTSSSRSRAISRGAISHRGENSPAAVYCKIGERSAASLKI